MAPPSASRLTRPHPRAHYWKEHIMSASPSGPATVTGAAVVGLDGYLAQVHAEASGGPPGLAITGLPDTTIRETRDRVYAAVANSGEAWPAHAITATVQPGWLARHLTGTDLPIAVAVLTAAGTIPAGAADGCVFAAGLGLDGTLRPVPGIAPALHAAVRAGCTRAVVAVPNSAEAVMVPGLTIASCESLRGVLAWLRGQPLPEQTAVQAVAAPAPAAGVRPVTSLAELVVPAQVRLAVEATATGGHHLGLTGPRGTRIPALAAAVAGLMPALSPGEVTEVTAIHSVAGLLGSGHALITAPPLRAPHHTATPAAIAGGGTGPIRPGEATLAHRGVLFLADAPEFARGVLDVLRQPLRDGEITIARHGSTARFTLIASMSPCPCGARPGCACTPVQARRYRARLAGTLGSYIPVWLTITSSSPSCGQPPGGDGGAGRVAAARDRARHRLRDTPWQVNADIPGADLRRYWPPPAEAAAPISRAADLGEISMRTADQVIGVAWTLADLAGRDRPGPADCGQALAFHLGVTR
jgi:magnesium chelatase family protein